jgi:hypothetical protein
MSHYPWISHGYRWSEFESCWKRRNSFGQIVSEHYLFSLSWFQLYDSKQHNIHKTLLLISWNYFVDRLSSAPSDDDWYLVNGGPSPMRQITRIWRSSNIV